MDNDEYEVRGLLDESITDLVIPSTYEGKIVSAIRGEAFIQCKSLQSVEFGTSIVEIGMWCFYECDSLTNLAIPTGTKRLSALVCYKCPNLKAVMIPSTIESIFKNAFKRCDSLTTIVCAMEKAPEGFMQGWNDTSAEVIWWADK